MLADDKRYYFDTTGCGNTINQFHPRVLQMIMDSLRYWAEECHVDGFRFDLASSLGRERREFEGNARFFDAVLQDPTLSQLKLIAEPWDVGEGGYRLGRLPAGLGGMERALPRRRSQLLEGRSGRSAQDGERPARARPTYSTGAAGGPGRASISSRRTMASRLSDLVAYDSKHNEANGEDNKDGHDDNRSWNCGDEGPTDDDKILDLRDRMRRNFMATLLLSQGTPMILMGDEVGRTQGGNNNAYCQDNEISWLNWSGIGARDEAFLDFTVEAHRLAQAPAAAASNTIPARLNRWHATEQETSPGSGPTATRWREADWNNGLSKCIGVMLCGNRGSAAAHTHERPLRGHRIQARRAQGPSGAGGCIVDTARGLIEPREPPAQSGAAMSLPARSLLLYEAER